MERRQLYSNSCANVRIHVHRRAPIISTQSRRRTSAHYKKDVNVYVVAYTDQHNLTSIMLVRCYAGRRNRATSRAIKSSARQAEG